MMNYDQSLVAVDFPHQSPSFVVARLLSARLTASVRKVDIDAVIHKLMNQFIQRLLHQVSTRVDK